MPVSSGLPTPPGAASGAPVLSGVRAVAPRPSFDEVVHPGGSVGVVRVGEPDPGAAAAFVVLSVVFSAVLATALFVGTGVVDMPRLLLPAAPVPVAAGAVSGPVSLSEDSTVWCQVGLTVSGKPVPASFVCDWRSVTDSVSYSRLHPSEFQARFKLVSGVSAGRSCVAMPGRAGALVPGWVFSCSAGSPASS